MKFIQTIVAICLAVSLVLGSPLPLVRRQDESESQNSTIVDIIQAQPDLSTLFTLLNETGLLAELNTTEANFTIFAPTDEAFAAALPEGNSTIDVLSSEPFAAVLQALLLYHVAPGTFPASEFNQTVSVPTLLGDSLVIIAGTAENSSVVLNYGDAYVVDSDLNATNGIVHKIDGVLDPISVFYGSSIPLSTITNYTRGQVSVEQIQETLKSFQEWVQANAASIPTLSDVDESVTIAVPTEVNSLIPSEVTEVATTIEVPAIVPTDVASAVPSDVLNSVPTTVPTEVPTEVSSIASSVTSAATEAATPEDAAPTTTEEATVSIETSPAEPANE